MGERLIDLAEQQADRVALLRIDPEEVADKRYPGDIRYLFVNERDHQNRRDGHRQKRGEEHGKGFSKCQRLKQSPRLGLKGEYRQEGHSDDQERQKERGPHFFCRLDDDFHPGAGLAGLHPLLQFLVGVLDHDDRGVDHGADGDGDAGQAHDIRGDAHEVHADKGHDDGERQGEDDRKGARQMEEKNDADGTDGNRQPDDLFLQGVDRPVDQIGAVVGGDDLDPRRQTRRDIPGDLFLHPFEHRQHVLAEADDDDAAGHLAFAVQLGKAAADVRAEAHLGDVADQDRRAAPVRAHGDQLDVLDFLDVAPAADHVFDAGEFDHPAFDVLVALPDGVHHLADRDIVGEQPVGVDGHLILFDEAADRGDLGDAGDAL